MELFDRMPGGSIWPINDDYDFKMGEGLTQDAVDSAQKKLRTIEGWDDDRNNWRLLIQYILPSDSGLHDHLCEAARIGIHLKGFSAKHLYTKAKPGGSQRILRRRNKRCTA